MGDGFGIFYTGNDSHRRILTPVNLWIALALAILIGLLAITPFFRHNLLFLRNVYLRRWVQAGEEAHYFQADPKDVNRCFGFRAANVAFNTRVRAPKIAGAAIFLRRCGVLVVSAREAPDVLRLAWSTR